jgi:2,3-bisphosphoglycerate-independent phosphoglycerate mutase
MNTKVLLFLIDGLADLPINGKTPLGEANKPNMDFFAKNGRVGTLNILSRKKWNELSRISNASISHFANISLLGFDPQKFKALKRGPLEAVGANIPYVEGHLALRCNFATVDENLNLIDRRAGRNSFGLDELVRYINENVNIGVKFTFMRTFEHRAVLILQKELSDKISTNDPFEIGKKVRKINGRGKGRETAKLVQKFVDKVYSLIRFHPVNEERVRKKLLPANYLLVREAGNKLLALPSFKNKWKVNPVCIAENGVVKATCLLAGFSSVTVPESSFEKTLDFIFKSIENCLPEYDLIYVHIKEPDKYAHDGNFDGKVKCIEKIDMRFEDLKDFNGVIVVTCDHITACKTGRHEQGRVPLLVYGKGKDGVKKFDELSAKNGSLKNFTPRKMWKFIFKG